MTLTLQGNGTLNGLTVLGAPVTTLANTGTAASPSLVFDGDSDTGLFRPGANQIALSVGGSARLTIASNGTTTFTNLETSAGSLTFGDYSSTTASSAKIWNNNSYGLYINGTGDSTHTAFAVYKVDATAEYKARIFHDGSAKFAGENFDLASYGALSIMRTDSQPFPLFRWGTTDSYTGGGIYPNGDGSFGAASNATNNNGVLIGGSNGSLNLYTTRYSTDCAQILNTSGSGNNIAHQFFGNGTLKVCGGDLQFSNITTDNTNSVRITTDPASTGSGSKLIFNMDASQDAVTIYNSGLKVGDSVNTERINLKGSDGGADFTGIITTNSPTFLSTVCQIQTDAKNTEAYSQTTIYNSQTIELHNSVSMGSAIIRFRSQSSNGSAGLWNIGAVPRTASTGADFIFQSRNTSGTYNESIRLDPNGGIKFNGDTAAANNLDDYEEGTFTPTVEEGADDGSGGAVPFAIQAGRYTKIGNKVYTEIYIRFATGSSSTSSHARIGGLPFNISNLSYGHIGASNLTRGGGTSSFHNTTNDITTNYGTSNTAYFYLYKEGGTNFIFGGGDNVNLTGEYWIGTFTYPTDS